MASSLQWSQQHMAIPLESILELYHNNMNLICGKRELQYDNLSQASQMRSRGFLQTSAILA